MKPTRTVAPLYPAIDQASKVQGVVWLCYTVKADGTVDDVHVVDTRLNTTNRDLMAALESAAMNALMQWRFNPHHINGKPVKTPDVCQKMEFKLS